MAGGVFSSSFMAFRIFSSMKTSLPSKLPERAASRSLSLDGRCAFPLRRLRMESISEALA